VKVSVRVEGLKELDLALAQLPKSIQKATLRRTLMKAGQPMAETARNLAPVDDGQLRKSITVSTKLKNPVGKSEFAAAMRAGLGMAAARSALRGARRAARAAGQVAFVEMYVGPSSAAPHAHFLEFGTSKMPPKPYMRPAFDSEKDNALAIIRRELGNEIIASARRIGRSKRYSADVKSGASMAALLAVEAGA
jgi:HK97 gp10 family phage protein